MDLHYPVELVGNDLRLADNKNLAITAIVSPLLTQIGERPLNPNYGGTSYLFDATEVNVSEIIDVFFEDDQ